MHSQRDAATYKNVWRQAEKEPRTVKKINLEIFLKIFKKV